MYFVCSSRAKKDKRQKKPIFKFLVSEKYLKRGVVDDLASSDADCPRFDSWSCPDQRLVGKVIIFCNPTSGGTFLSSEIDIIKWVKTFAVAQAKVSHIFRPRKASERTQKGVIPPSMCEISQNA
jgi:hypothetical protein